ncbi:MAG: hypothetical protein AAF170_01710 [Bacteroidota bacterium]
MSRSLFLLARTTCLFSVLLLFSCDTNVSTADGTRASSSAEFVTVSLDGRPSADYYYDLAPLHARERFEATLVGSAGALRLRFLGTGGGRGSVELETAKKHPSVSVRLYYMADGSIIQSRNFRGKLRSTYEAGVSDREPDSVHYVQKPNGGYIIVFDYDDDKDIAGPGTTVTAQDGDRIDVTHIRFVVDYAGVGTPELLEFSSPSAFALR